MAWTKGSPLVATVVELQKFVGPHALTNLETGGYAITDLLTRASDEVRGRVGKTLVGDADVSRITNEDDYKPGVAAHALALLVMGGFVPVPEGQVAPLDPFEWSWPRVQWVQPELSDGKAPPSSGLARPSIRNSNSNYFG